VEGQHLLDVYALSLSRVAGADVALPGARRLLLLRRRVLFLVRGLRGLRNLFVLLLHLPFDQYWPVVPVLDRSAVPGVADREGAVAADG